MRQKNLNAEHIEGRLYQHDLSVRKVQNQSSPNYGKEFISGSIDIATDEEAMNVLTVHFTYMTEFTKTGAKNQTYANLQKIIREGKAWITDGKDVATKLKVDTSLALNDFYNQDDSLVSVKTNEGGFVTLVNELCDENDRNTFQMDMFITGVKTIEADAEKGIDTPYDVLHGAVFNFRNDLLPVDFVVRNANGMKYFEDAGISNSTPVFTKVWGKIASTTSVTERVEESAFGEAAIKKYEKKTKEWVVTGTAKIPYDFGDETVLTADDIKKAMQNRDVYLADIKQKRDEYNAAKAAAENTPSGISNDALNSPLPFGNEPIKKGTFNF